MKHLKSHAKIVSALAAFNSESIIPSAISSLGVKPSWLVILQIGIRLLLSATLTVAAMIALVSAYNWINSEGNEEKSHENKDRLGKMLIVITVTFALMALFRMWVPDYSTLHL